VRPPRLVRRNSKTEPSNSWSISQDILRDPRKAVTLAMRAVAVMFLTHIPLRLANLQGLLIDEHLYRSGTRERRFAGVRIQAADTKNRRLIDFPIPTGLADLLQEWIDDVRPIIARDANPYLFPGFHSGDRPITPQALREAIRETLLREAGVALTPHQFRHLAAVSFLMHHPGQYEIVRHLLGHADHKTTLRSYCGPERTAAIACFVGHVAERSRARRGPARRPKPPGRKAGTDRVGR
jgi:integrase